MEFLDKAALSTSLFSARLTGARKPIVVHINITNKCNLNCPYCYGMYSKRKVRDFTTEELDTLLNQLAAMGTRRVNLGAGEPLVRKDIGHLVDYTRKKGMVCNMNTNGHLVPQKIKEIKNLNTLCISIDGDEKVHDSGKGKGSFKKVLEAIKIAQAHHVNVHTSTCITKDNVNTIETVLKLSRQMGFVTEWLLPFFQSTENFLASNKDYKKALRTILDYKRRGYPILLSEKAIEYTLNWPDYRTRSITGEMPKGAIPCYAGRYMCIIDSTGLVYPCSQMIDTDFPAKNFLTVGFKEAWDNLKDHGCKSCYAFMAFNDYNLLISLDPATIWNYTKNAFTEVKLRK